MLPITMPFTNFLSLFDMFLPYLSKGFQFSLLLSPITVMSFLLISLIYIGLKTTAAKLIFFGASVLIAMFVSYFIYKEDKKKKLTKKIEVDFNDSFFCEEKELILTKLFKK